MRSPNTGRYYQCLMYEGHPPTRLYIRGLPHRAGAVRNFQDYLYCAIGRIDRVSPTYAPRIALMLSRVSSERFSTNLQTSDMRRYWSSIGVWLMKSALNDFRWLKRPSLSTTKRAEPKCASS